MARPDEFLSFILTEASVPDGETQTMSSRGHLQVGQTEGRVAHVTMEPLESEEDTDNAWSEADVWAANLRLTRSTNTFTSFLFSGITGLKESLTGYEWQSIKSDRISPKCRCFVAKAVQAFSL